MATRTWDGGASTQVWADAANWSDNTVPIAGDDVVIPTGMGIITATLADANLAFTSLDIAGTSSLVITVGGASEAWAVDAYTSWTSVIPIEWIFSGENSLNAGNITGNCLFSGAGSYNYGGNIAGNCEFSGENSLNAGNITGNCEFSGNSSYNYGTITGNCLFSGAGSYNYGGNIAGNCVFSGDSSYNGGSITGDCEFSGNSSYNYAGTITGNCVFSGTSSYNSYSITGDCTFSGDSSYNGGSITGNCDLQHPASYIQSATVTGTVTFRNTGSVTTSFNNGLQGGSLAPFYSAPGAIVYPFADVLGGGLL